MDVKAVYALDSWFVKGECIPQQFRGGNITGMPITRIQVEAQDPRNDSPVPANVYIRFEDGSHCHLQARDILSYFED